MLLVGATYMAFSPSDMGIPYVWVNIPHLKQGIQPAARRCFRTQPQGQTGEKSTGQTDAITRKMALGIIKPWKYLFEIIIFQGFQKNSLVVRFDCQKKKDQTCIGYPTPHVDILPKTSHLIKSNGFGK